MNNEKIKVALVLGGTSPERPVSKDTAKAIYGALINLGYDITLVDPAYGKNQPEKPEHFFAEEDFTKLSNRNYVEAINSKLFDEIDIAFIALHGKWGEDGTIQSLLELRGIKYTGSNVLSSSISMDKIMSKILFHHFDIPTPDWFSVRNETTNTKAVQDLIEKEFGYPCVIKPNDQGSTFGLSVCKSKDDVEEALQLSFKYSDKTIVEKYIPGHEMTVGILENKALPVLEIKPKSGLYDYEAKYEKGMSEYEVPAKIPKESEQQLLELGLKAFEALNCSGYGRVDFRMTDDYKVYCLEVNTLPGMTGTSLVPKMAKEIGIPFDELIDRIIKTGL